MITYKICTNDDIENMYEAFSIGFSDYMVKFDITLERFIDLFLRIEGNQLEYSLLALDNEKPIGLMLGGIKTYDGVKTLRCGTLAIDPDYRKVGVASQLFMLHKELAIKNDCKVLFLEVIKNNDRALNFYLKHDYKIAYDIVYYKNTDLNRLTNPSLQHLVVKEISIKEAKAYYDAYDKYHINWQNDFDYQKELLHINYFGAYINNDLVGVIAVAESGKVFYLHVLNTHRLNGIGRQLLCYAKDYLKLRAFVISFINNDKLLNFLQKCGFEQFGLSQYEMYRIV